MADKKRPTKWPSSLKLPHQKKKTLYVNMSESEGRE
jgi:hypothetical protein